MKFRASLSILVLLLTAAGASTGSSAWAQDTGPSFEQAAEKLQAATLTVRVSERNEVSPREVSPRNEAAAKVTVFTGISVGRGIVVTPLFTPDDMRIRITMPGGAQAEATPRVLDEHSGLALLEIEAKDAPSLALAEDSPKVGAWVLSGAGWGVEKAVVSLGIVSGVDRSLPGANYPPLLQCDLRTAATSSGAAVVNNRGELLGVVIAAETEMEGRRGWTYAVPARHVKRMQRALAEQEKSAAGDNGDHENSNADKSGDGVVVLKPRRPVVGMVLGPAGEGDVVVKKVSGSGPAEKAGIREGDEILAADGIVIRSVYQAVRPLLYKQPGDVMEFLVRDKSGEVRPVEVVLGGGVLLPSAPSVKLANVIEPKIIVSGRPPGDILRQGGNLAEVAVGADDVAAEDGAADIEPADETIASLQQKVRLQEKALDRYRSAIAAQQVQIGEALQDRLKTEEELLRLKAEIQRLSKQLQPTRPASSR
ncbi:MAG: S1C family serine protease [Pirellulaceae bacterium]